MSSAPHWLEYIRALGPALIALFVAWVAYQQWQVNKATAKEKLFDRRLEIYRGAREFYIEMHQTGTCSDEALGKMSETWAASLFLFPEEFRECLLAFRSLGVDLMHHNRLGKDGSDRVLEVQNALPDEFNKLIDAFRPFMTFSELDLQK